MPIASCSSCRPTRLRSKKKIHVCRALSAGASVGPAAGVGDSTPFTAAAGPPKLYPHDPRLVSPPSIVAVGSSTGGPNALMALLKPLKGLPVPIVITQHMPQTFTAILAQHIEKSSGIPTAEGAEDMVLEPGHAYVAPGGYHMLFKRASQGETAIHIDDGPVENFCRPAVDPMLRSLVSIYGSKILAVILTGIAVLFFLQFSQMNLDKLDDLRVPVLERALQIFL